MEKQEYKWWQNATVYQVYPRSFFDADGDGNGDLRGITAKLDYIKSLGVDVVWSSPYFKSPMADGGYDVADYRDINPMFGTLDDWKEMLHAVHERGMKFVMDLVVNHSSNEHPWFLSARSSKDSPYRDYYYFKPGKDNGDEPTNWASVFGGSAWQKTEETGEYYLHLFAKEQPDLNWSNPKVTDEVVDIMNFWCDLGVDGFRLDAINYMHKNPAFPDVEPMPGSKYGFATEHYASLPPVHDHFKNLNSRVWKPRSAMTVAELAYVDTETGVKYCHPDREELDMLYLFDILNIDQDGFDKFAPLPLDLPLLKRTLNTWQQAMHNNGWLALFIGNHDQPRAVDRFGDTGRYHKQSAKMIAAAMYFLQGTPYIFQGDEIGMTNVSYKSVHDFRDVEVMNTYNEFVLQKGEDEAKWLHLFNTRSRDNGRTPMQWDDTPQAGFTAGTPWIPVNDNYKQINVAAQENDPDSILNFYRKLIKVRKDNQCVIFGDIAFTDLEDKEIFAYTRTYGEHTLLCVCNFTDDNQFFALPENVAGKQGEILLNNYDDVSISEGVALRPYECVVVQY